MADAECREPALGRCRSLRDSLSSIDTALHDEKTAREAAVQEESAARAAAITAEATARGQDKAALEARLKKTRTLALAGL